jgi:hypothetical protein
MVILGYLIVTYIFNTIPVGTKKKKGTKGKEKTKQGRCIHRKKGIKYDLRKLEQIEKKSKRPCQQRASHYKKNIISCSHYLLPSSDWPVFSCSLASSIPVSTIFQPHSLRP